MQYQILTTYTMDDSPVAMEVIDEQGLYSYIAVRNDGRMSFFILLMEDGFLGCTVKV